MLRARRLLVWAAAAVCVPPLALAEPGWEGDANLLLGGRRLNYDDWEPTHRLGQLGIVTSFLPSGWPVALAGDLLLAGAEEPSAAPGGRGEQRARTTELDLGVRKAWRATRTFRPYLGGGLAFVNGRIERAGPAGTVSDEDDGMGLWLGGGLGWTLSRSFNVGLDARVSRARARLFGDNKNVGGASLGLFLGYHWGGEHEPALPPPSVPAAPSVPPPPPPVPAGP